MVLVLESHLALLEQQAVMAGEMPTKARAVELADMISLHVHLLDVLDARLGCEGVAESHRPLVPLFQRWLDAARVMQSTARQWKAQGQKVEGLDDLARAMNRSKPVAEHFDYFVDLNERLARGEEIKYTPMDEVFEQLRSRG